jgi:hypothetical protein
VSIPGRDHLLLPEIDIPAIDAQWAERGEQHLTLPKFGAMVKDWVKTGRTIVP